MVRLYSPRRLCVVGKIDPQRARSLLFAHPRTAQRIVDAQIRVPVKGVPRIVPGWVDSPVRMVSAERIGPVLSEWAAVGGSRFRRKPRIV